MTSRLSGTDALANAKKNAHKSWNKSSSSSERSSNSDDASNRIYDWYASLAPQYKGPKFHKNAKVFAMGSCFAREIEHALSKRGGNVISVDNTIKRPEFMDASGNLRSTFLHRYTTSSMCQEFAWPFQRVPNWSDDALIFKVGEDSYLDLNYADFGGSATKESVLTRRSIAADLVRKVADANIVILTLGLIEGWRHIPTGLSVNAISGKVLLRQRDDYELVLETYDSVMEHLSTIYNLIRSVHKTGDFQLFVTVSPVPLAQTFTDMDIVIANETSKATLRSAAIAFVAETINAHYFPSYEMVKYTAPSLAWRPDSIHVNMDMVTKIMDLFISTAYYEDVFALK